MKHIIIISIIIMFSVAFTLPAQVNWNKNPNPVLTPDSTGAWDDLNVGIPCVIHVGDTYHMWYDANWDNAGTRTNGIGYATSNDGINWAKDTLNPILLPTAGSWDSGAVSRAVVLFNNSDSLFHMWYSGWGTTSLTSYIGHATSPDGGNWTKDTINNPVLNPGSPGSWDDDSFSGHCVILLNNTFYMWYAGYRINGILGIGHATSPDGITWTKYDDPVMTNSLFAQSDPVLRAGTSSDWDYPAVRMVNMIFDGFRFHMFYTGGGWFTYDIGYAYSTDGINWTKYVDNPVLQKGPTSSWDDYCVMSGSVVFSSTGDSLKMWYTGASNGASTIQIGYATALDISYAYYIKPHSSFVRLIDTLTITADVRNRHNYNLHVAALINTIDDVFVDSISMFDDGNHSDSLAGDNLYGCYLNPLSSEDVYTISASVTDLDSNRYHILTNGSRFTTIGPVVFDSDSISKGFGSSYKLFLKLRNDGLLATANNVTAAISTTDSAVTSITNNSGGFGDIEVGQTITSSGFFTINTFNLQDPDTINFDIEIFSNGYSFWYDNTDVVITGLSKNKSNIPKTYSLSQNYPNPFNPNTTIEFSIPKTETVTLKIFNLLGQEVASLVSDKLTPGKYNYTWDASAFASGVYFYKLESGDFIKTKKLILIK